MRIWVPRPLRRLPGYGSALGRPGALTRISGHILIAFPAPSPGESAARAMTTDRKGCRVATDGSLDRHRIGQAAPRRPGPAGKPGALPGGPHPPPDAPGGLPAQPARPRPDPRPRCPRGPGMLIGTVLAGFAGPWLAVEQLHLYHPAVVAGRGWIALVIVGGGRPWLVGGGKLWPRGRVAVPIAGPAGGYPLRDPAEPPLRGHPGHARLAADGRATSGARGPSFREVCAAAARRAAPGGAGQGRLCPT